MDYNGVEWLYNNASLKLEPNATGVEMQSICLDIHSYLWPHRMLTGSILGLPSFMRLSLVMKVAACGCCPSVLFDSTVDTIAISIKFQFSGLNFLGMKSSPRQTWLHQPPTCSRVADGRLSQSQPLPFTSPAGDVKWLLQVWIKASYSQPGVSNL